MKITAPYKLCTKKIRLSLNKYNILNFFFLCKKNNSLTVIKNINIRNFFFGYKKKKISIDILLNYSYYTVSLNNSKYNIRYKKIKLNNKIIHNNHFLKGGDLISINIKNNNFLNINYLYKYYPLINDKINKTIYYL